MFYIIRKIFIIILALTAWFVTRQYIKRVKKIVAKGEKYTKRKFYAIYLSIFLFAFLLSALSFIPFEGAFIRFDSVEDSLKYKWIDTQYLTIHYEDDCAFAVKGCTEFYAFDKDNEGFGLLNYHSVTHLYNEPPRNAINHNMFNLYSVYHKTTDKTFYLLNNGMRSYSIDFNDNNSNFTYFAQPLYTKSDLGYTPIIGEVYQYYAVDDGQPLEKVSFMINGQLETFTL